MNVAPIPWTNLISTSIPSLEDAEHPRDAREKTAVPTRNILRMSARSASLEKARHSPAMGMRYATDTKALDDTDMPSSLEMSGRTTFTMDASIPSTAVARTISAMTAPVCVFASVMFSRTCPLPP